MNSFRFEEQPNSIGLLTFDLPGKKVNTLGRSVLAELSQAVSRLRLRTDLQGLLFQSGKPGRFIAGADLKELEHLPLVSQTEILQVIAAGRSAFDSLASLPFPTVALIDGACLGGGAELVLAMDARIVSDSPTTQICLPEVNLGLIPSWGGTQRLPRLIGAEAAIDRITSGLPLSAEESLAIGLADALVPSEDLIREGVTLLQRLRESVDWESDRERRSNPMPQPLEAIAAAERLVLSRTTEENPAPIRAFETIRDGLSLPLSQALDREAETAAILFGSKAAAARIAEFFRKSRDKRDLHQG